MLKRGDYLIIQQNTMTGRMNRPGFTGAPIAWEKRAMNRYQRYPREVRKRALRLVLKYMGIPIALGMGQCLSSRCHCRDHPRCGAC